MIDFDKKKDAKSFVAAAGLIAHYVGDACQPLHGSMYADGDPSRTVTRKHPKTGKVDTVAYASGVHSAYETKMLDRKRPHLVDLLTNKMPNSKHGLPLVKSGADAA